MDETQFEKVLRQALQIQARSEMPRDDFSRCLSDDTVQRICEGTLAEHEREKVLEHLNQCERCRRGVRLYFDLMESTQKLQSGDRETIQLKRNGEPVPHPAIHWLRPGRSFTIEDITEPGIYELMIGSHFVTFDCKAENLIQAPQAERPTKAAASEGKPYYVREIVSEDKALTVGIVAGRNAGRFEVQIRQ